MIRADQLMTRGGKAVSEATRLEQAAKLLAEFRMPALPVVDHFGRVLGVITETAASSSPAHDLADVMVVIDELPSEDADLRTLAETMLRHEVAVLPIIFPTTGQLAGTVSDRDLLRGLTAEAGPARPKLNVSAVCAELDALRVERIRRGHRWRRKRQRDPEPPRGSRVTT